MLCALVNPRYETIIEDTKGNIGTYVFGGINHIIPSKVSSLGPSRKMEINALNTVSAIMTKIPLLCEEGITLYDNYYIVSDQEFNISCFSYNINKWVNDIPLVQKNMLPIMDSTNSLDLNVFGTIVFGLSAFGAKLTIRTLIKIIPITYNDQRLLWFIYQDIIITYNCTENKWITELDDNNFHLFNFKIFLLFPADTKCIFTEYDEDSKTLIFLDSNDNIAIYDVEKGQKTVYDGMSSSPNKTIYLNADVRNEKNIINNINKFVLIKGYSRVINNEGFQEYTTIVIICNDKICQLLEYNNDSGLIKVNEIDYSDEESNIIDIIQFKEDSRFYILFDNQKIVEFSTYMYNPYIVQNKRLNTSKIVISDKSYCNIIKVPLYITADNKAHLIHVLYNKKENTSELGIPIYKYIAEGASIKKYTETFIHESSISLFSYSHYALMSYLDSLKYPISARS
jgi:hypothetical protein